MISKNKIGQKESGDDNVLVYSTDGPLPKRCSGCQRPESQCCCAAKSPTQTLKPSVRMERKGRGGKTVTVLGRLPAHDTLLKELCGFLKRSLGCGGTHYIIDGEGAVEIQGDRRATVLELVELFNAKAKNTAL